MHRFSGLPSPGRSTTLTIRDIECSWQRDRSRINHDWLKSQYLPALGAMISVLNEDVECTDLERQLGGLELDRWADSRARIEALAREFEIHMSPRALFCRPPLDKCDKRTKEWLPELVHMLWRARNPVDAWVRGSLTAVAEADAAWGLLGAGLHGCRRPYQLEEVQAILPEFTAFRTACQEIARAIEQFPNRILVT